MKIFNALMVSGLMLTSVAISGSIWAAETPKDMAVLYLEQCSICHGDKGDAQTRSRSGMMPKPRDFTTAEAAMELTRARMINSVTNGRPGTAMVGHKGRLSETQIAALVDYVRTNFMQVPVTAQGGIPEPVSLGEKLYTKSCQVCHGDKGNTSYWAKNGLNPPPRDFTSPEAQSDLTRARMISAVTKGRPGTGMVSFSTRLSTEEIAAVVGFIRFKFMGVDPDKDSGVAPMAQVAAAPVVTQPLVAADPVQQTQIAPLGMGMTGSAPQGAGDGHTINVDMSEAIPNKLKADMKWGREFYMKYCFTCHGVKGDGNGPRAYFNRPRPRDFTSDASRQVLNRPRVFDSIAKGRVGTVMPAWGKVLTEQEIANLTEFVFQAYIQGKGAAVPDKAGAGKASSIKGTAKKKTS